MPVQKLKDFLKLEATAGILLFLGCLTALAMKNTFLEPYYDTFLTTPVIIKIGEFSIHKPLLLWINDGFMAIFFLLVGLEIKREMLQGQLSSKEQTVLPLIAALGGIAVPALIYLFVNWDHPEALDGWAIPAATDIAFALGILALLGKRIPEQIKITLLAIAIIDDLAAVVIIALFYTDHLSVLSLSLGGLAVVVLFILNRFRVTHLAPYMITGLILWTCVLKSGVHATLAGVVVALFIPIKEHNSYGDGNPPLVRLEHDLHPWVAFGVLPLFAFANSGVSLKGINLDILSEPITLGIIAGLLIGKPVGVLLLTFLGILFRVCRLPNGIEWKMYVGMALLTGVGFTMSLFIGTLAFDDIHNQNAVRLGVLAGSTVSGLLGYFVLRLVSKPQTA